MSEKCKIIWPRGADGLYRRVLLDIALPCGNFKLEISSPRNDYLNDPETLLIAAHRVREWLNLVLTPEVNLREQWATEDAAKSAEESAGDVPMGAQ